MLTMNVERIMELENHHLATVIVINSTEKYVWMLSYLVKNSWGIGYLQSQHIPLYKIFINEEGEKNKFTVEKPGKYHLICEHS